MTFVGYSIAGIFTQNTSTLGFQQMFDVTITALMGAQTAIDITGLNLETEYLYLFKLDIISGAGGIGSLSMFANADYVAANYQNQYFEASGAGVFAGRQATGEILFFTGVGDLASTEIWISKLAGQNPIAFVNSSNIYAGPAIVRYDYAWTHLDTTNVTVLRIASAVAAGLAVGTRLRGWKSI